MSDTVVMAGYPVGRAAAHVLALYGLGRSFADICRDAGQDTAVVARVIAAAKHQRGRAAQMALAWQQHTRNSLLDVLKVRQIGPPPPASDAELRAWAAGRGLPCNQYGRVPAHIRIAHERLMAEDLRVP